ncbi:phospholipase D family protein [Vibrio sp. D415a]|uniref:phospholipase D family protein n=1 Tax=unclassified Vibrio TaxID=2614977 RepID=UPI001A3509C3|nr:MULTISPECIES: phospholipase D family protein [unclassified Vibrio]EJI6684965.1 phospholipase D family protein [Vibrio parahaemolyticus]EJK2407327.1 phospholipase D family protein [Vibrio parahaemolyticus]ELI5445804.1 phospholipase D family protein [Vibrio parahaemolyticus]MDK9728717.1 phospholipase D family protein [Vibrio sp. D415a]MDK9745132.1 phospholipase D family protein [Vibrio sp. D409a]
MAKFLNTSATNYYLEELIKNASERLILISPFLKLNDRIRELLEDKDRLKIDIRIVYGKSELQPDEINWLKGLSFVRTSFCKNLHAKCYMNESACIITSLNLYEFSQVNNNEMGIFIDRDEDPNVYKDSYEEAQRIIRISDEVRISLEKVTSSTNDPSKIEDSEPEKAKLTSSKLAKKHKIKTDDFLQMCVSKGYLSFDDGKHSLTEEGKSLGGEFKYSKRFGPYFIWPESLEVE